MVMLELAPRQLQAQINNHVSELDKAIEIERLRLESKQLDNAMLVIHGAATVLALRGQGDQVVEIDRPTIEVIDDRSKAKFEGQTTKQLADYCNAKFGTKFKSGAEVVRMLKSAGFQDLIATTPRAVLQDYIPMENIDTALRVLTEGNRQKLIGER
jgi:hypothetical protein